MAVQRTVTVGPGGTTGGYDYATLNGAITGEAKDLVGLNRQLDIVCHPMADGTTASVGSDWVTDATRFLRIRAAQNHGGKWNTGVYRLEPNSATGLAIFAAFVRVEDLQIRPTGASAATIPIDLSPPATGASDVRVDRCILRCNPSNTSNAQHGVLLRAGTGAVRSTLIYDFANTTGTSQRGITSNGAALYAYNVTVVTVGTLGFLRNSGIFAVKNCIALGATSACYSGVFDASSTNNISSDATAPGTNFSRSTTVAFVDAAARDYHLAPTDTVARGTGADLSADPAYPFTFDIDRQTINPAVLAWSRGADWPAPANVAPAAPTVTVDQIATTSARLNGSAFSDPDAGNTHAATRWQVSTVADFATTIYDSGAAGEAALLQKSVTGLTARTGYFARAQYQDNAGAWSAWSASASFTTLAALTAPVILTPAEGAIICDPAYRVTFNPATEPV